MRPNSNLDARDEAIRRLAPFYSGLSARRRAMAIECDLCRITARSLRVLDDQSKRSMLQRAVDLGARSLGWKQVRNILDGARTPGSTQRKDAKIKSVTDFQLDTCPEKVALVDRKDRVDGVDDKHPKGGPEAWD